jgi:DNA-binding response OmpR family regulator
MQAEPCPTILLFAEDPWLRRAIARTLERDGAVVVEVDSAAHARSRCGQAVLHLAIIARGPDLHEADELASDLRRRHPRLRMLYTGSSTGAPGESHDFLEMPFSPVQLSARTRKLLACVPRACRPSSRSE